MRNEIALLRPCNLEATTTIASSAASTALIYRFTDRGDRLHGVSGVENLVA